MITAAAVWFHWLAWLLVLSAVFGLALIGVGYYVKVVLNKAPRRSR